VIQLAHSHAHQPSTSKRKELHGTQWRDKRFPAERSHERYDVIVVGAGQAGLAIADQIAGVAAARAQGERWASETLGAFRPAAVTEGA
jgi:hypothetical protein